MRLIILIILTTLSLSAVEWQKADVPGTRLYMSEDIVDYKGKLIIRDRSTSHLTFVLEDGTWSTLNDGFLDTLSRIYAIEQIENIIFISSRNGNFYSSNYGDTWASVERIGLVGAMSKKYYFGSGLNRQLFKFSFENEEWTLATYTNDSNNLDTLVGDLIECEGDLLASSEWAAFPLAEPGIRVSTDAGETWYDSPSFDKLVVTMEIADGVIYAMATDKKLYFSEDNGMTWQATKAEELTINELVAYKSNLYSSMKNAVYKSSDNGNTWELFVDGVEDFVIENIKVVGEKLILLTERSQLYIYSEENEKWEYNPFLEEKLICKNLVERNDTLFALGNRRGVIYSVDGGENWEIFNEQFSKYFEHFSELHINDDLIVLDNYGQELYISDDRGNSWTKSNIGYFDPFDPPINDILLEEDRIILTTNTGLKVSTNKGEDWINHYGGELAEEEKIGSMFVLDSAYYIFKKTGIIMSPSTLDNWVYALDSNKLSELGIFNISKYTESNLIFYSTDVRKEDYAVYSYSLDTGEDEIFCDYPNKDTAAHALQREKSSYIMAYGSSVIVSHDEGENWKAYKLDIFGPDSLRGNFIYNLLVKDNRLIVATRNGIAYADLSEFGITTTVENDIERNYLYTLPPYPNPATNTVNIDLDYEQYLQANELEIKVYDVIGNEVSTEGEVSIEDDKVMWNCASKPPGVYFIRIDEEIYKVIKE